MGSAHGRTGPCALAGARNQRLKGKLDQALLALLLACGLRRHEVVAFWCLMLGADFPALRIHILMLQKNPESESVRNQQQRHNDSRNEVSRSQLPGQEPGMIGLVESV